MRPRSGGGFVLALALLTVAAVAGPQLRGVYPFTYDELVYLRKVRAYDTWLREGAAAARSGRPLALFSRAALGQAEALEDMHPGFAKLAALLPHWLFRAVLHREGGGRLAGSLFLALAAGVLYWFLRPTVGPFFAGLGALGLVSLPRLFGHAHFLALDVPAMAMCLLAAVAFHRAAETDRWGPCLLAGVAVGAALGTKLNAVALLPHMLLWLLAARPPGWRKALLGLLPAPLVFVACWPWLWPDLPGQLARYAAFHAAHFQVGTSYFGHVYQGSQGPPASYSPVMFLLTLPLVWAVGTLGSLGATAARRLPAPAGYLALGLSCQLGLTMLPAATRYAADRLLIPALPWAVGLVVLGAHQLLARAAVAPPRRWAAVAVAVALLVPNLVGIVRTYPYCLSYYGELVGLSGAARLGLEITYWGDAYAGARAFMRRPEQAQARFYVSNELATGVLDAHLHAGEVPPQHLLFGRWVRGELPADADWIMVDNHPPMWPPAVAELVRTAAPAVTIQRGGTPLLWIFPGPARGHQPADAGKAPL